MAALRKYSKLQVERAVRLVGDGKSYMAAARIAGMTVGAVRNHAAGAGVASTRRAGHRSAFAPGARPFTDAEDAQIVEMRAFGRSFTAIGAVLGRNKTSIRSRLHTLQQRKIRGEH